MVQKTPSPDLGGGEPCAGFREAASNRLIFAAETRSNTVANLPARRAEDVSRNQAHWVPTLPPTCDVCT